MVFCNNKDVKEEIYSSKSHNPYFNRWFSAITEVNIQTVGDSESQSLF